jgi:hypothetical protein
VDGLTCLGKQSGRRSEKTDPRRACLPVTAKFLSNGTNISRCPFGASEMFLEPWLLWIWDFVCRFANRICSWFVDRRTQCPKTVRITSISVAIPAKLSDWNASQRVSVLTVIVTWGLIFYEKTIRRVIKKSPWFTKKNLWLKAFY